MAKNIKHLFSIFYLNSFFKRRKMYFLLDFSTSKGKESKESNFSDHPHILKGHGGIFKQDW